MALHSLLELTPWVKALDEKEHTPKEKAMREKRTVAVAIFDDLESRLWGQGDSPCLV